MGILDSQRIDIPSPKCSHKTSETIAKLRLNPKLVCRGCGSALDIDPRSLAQTVKQAEKSIADLKRSLGRLR